MSGIPGIKLLHGISSVCVYGKRANEELYRYFVAAESLGQGIDDLNLSVREAGCSDHVFDVGHDSKVLRTERNMKIAL